MGIRNYVGKIGRLFSRANSGNREPVTPLGEVTVIDVLQTAAEYEELGYGVNIHVAGDKDEYRIRPRGELRIPLEEYALPPGEHPMNTANWYVTLVYYPAGRRLAAHVGDLRKPGQRYQDALTELRTILKDVGIEEKNGVTIIP